MGFYAEYAALVPDPDSLEMRAPVVLRLYWPGSTCYACLWAGDTSGSGRAGGGGYCKASAAADAAITNAGFDLSHSISGAGTNAIKEAVLAVAAALGYPEARLHYSHA